MVLFLSVFLLAPMAMAVESQEVAPAPYHFELDTALATSIELDSVSLQNTVRMGVQGNHYSLDLAAMFEGSDFIGIGPSFSLDIIGLTLQLDGIFNQRLKMGQATLKYGPLDNVNVGVFARSDMRMNYKFGLIAGVEF